MFQMYEREERDLVKENSREALSKALRLLKKRKEIIKLPLAGKKITILPSGKIKTEILL